MHIKKIQLWIAGGFFLISNFIAFSGADFPPLTGFLWIISITSIIAVIQYFYCGWLLPTIGKSPTFLLTLNLFSAIGTALYLIFEIFTDELHSHFFEGMFLVICGFLVYGIIFWIINKIISRYIKM